MESNRYPVGAGSGVIIQPDLCAPRHRPQTFFIPLYFVDRASDHPAIGIPNLSGDEKFSLQR